MNSTDVLTIVAVILGIYIALNIKKDYQEFRKSKKSSEFRILINDIGAIIGCVGFLIYRLIKFFS